MVDLVGLRRETYKVIASLRLLTGRRLLSPVGEATRPTSSRVREAVLNLLGQKIEGSYWLDLCSGSGVMGCEALQRGASLVVAVERHAKTAELCETNLLNSSKGLPQKVVCRVFRKEVLSFLKGGPKQEKLLDLSRQRPLGLTFDTIYFDPPYASGLYLPVIRSLLSGGWLSRDGIVICEHSTEFDLKPPRPWKVIDQRVYGNSALLLISLPKNYSCDTDSKHQQIGP